MKYQIETHTPCTYAYDHPFSVPRGGNYLTINPIGAAETIEEAMNIADKESRKDQPKISEQSGPSTIHIFKEIAVINYL